jgi:hypothetical protein
VVSPSFNSDGVICFARYSAHSALTVRVKPKSARTPFAAYAVASPSTS